MSEYAVGIAGRWVIGLCAAVLAGCGSTSFTPVTIPTQATIQVTMTVTGDGPADVNIIQVGQSNDHPT